jgi:hypothetical protein
MGLEEMVHTKARRHKEERKGGDLRWEIGKQDSLRRPLQGVWGSWRWCLAREKGVS